MTGRRRLTPVPDSPRRAVALVRVSKVGGRDDLASPEIQRVSIEDYARPRGIEVVEWVEALDESASRAKSAWWPRLEQAVAQVEAGERDVVLVWKVSRAARHRRNWAVAVDRIEVAGGTIESATEGLDTTTSTGRLARGMLAELAAWESEVKGEQWKEAQARRLRRGLPHDGRHRFGYRYDRRAGYTLDPDTSKILAGMYRDYARGVGFSGIAKQLNRTGVPTIRGARAGWSVQAVIRVMASGFAAGLIRVGEEFHQGAHEALITIGEWEMFLRLRRQRAVVPARVREPSYALTGLVKCGLCRYAMVASSSRVYGRGYMYRCVAHINYRTCPGLWITRLGVEAAVKEWLAEQVADVDAVAATKAARVAATSALRAERKALTREVARWDAAIERARGYLVDGTLTRTEFVDERDRIDLRRREISKRLDELVTEQQHMTGPMVTVARGLLRDWDTLSVRARRDLLLTLLRRVEIHPGADGGAKVVRPRPLWEPDDW